MKAGRRSGVFVDSVELNCASVSLGLDIEITHIKDSDLDKKLIHSEYNGRILTLKGRKGL